MSLFVLVLVLDLFGVQLHKLYFFEDEDEHDDEDELIDLCMANRGGRI